MPCDYKNYPTNWKTKIRPDILKRSENDKGIPCCEFCKVENKSIVCRGEWGGVTAYQDDNGCIFNAENGEYIGSSYCGDIWVGTKQILVKIILTIAHLDHDTTNNEYENLKALCQKCHNNYDAKNRLTNRRKTKFTNQQKLF